MVVVTGTVRGLLVSVMALGYGSGGCGASLPVGPVTDDAASGTDAGTVERVAPRERPMACGGQISSSGTGPDGPFTASYVYVERCDGDCQSLIVVVAEGTTFASQSLTFLLRSGDSGTYLGMRAVSVLLQRAGESTWTTLSGTVDVTVAEPEMLVVTSLNGPPFGTVAGTFTIEDGGIDLRGTFSSPVCASRLAI